MTQHARKSDHLQLVDVPRTTIVEIPLPLLGALEKVEQSFFELPIDAGQQVLASMMEQWQAQRTGTSRWVRDRA